MYNQPLAQAVMITFLNLGVIIYLLWRYPLKNPVKLLQNIVREVVLMLVNGCVVALAIFDAMRIQNERNREKLGDIIMYCSIIFSWLELVFLLIHAIFISIVKWKESRHKEARLVLSAQMHSPLESQKEPKPPKIAQKEEVAGDRSSLAQLNQSRSRLFCPVSSISILQQTAQQPIFTRARANNIFPHILTMQGPIAIEEKVTDSRNDIHFKDMSLTVRRDSVSNAPDVSSTKDQKKRGGTNKSTF